MSWHRHSVLGLAVVLIGCGDDGGGAGAIDGGPTSAGDARAIGSPTAECEGAPPEWIFCSGFEEGNKDIWDDFDGNPDETNLIIEEGGPLGFATNQVMRLRVPAGRGGADLIKVLPEPRDRVYARWYAQWEPGYDWSAPNHGSGLHAGDRANLGRSNNRPNGDDWFSSWLEPIAGDGRLNAYTYYRGMYMDCVDPMGSCWGDHFPCLLDEGEAYCERPEHRETVNPPVMESGRWYCIEMMLDGGTPSADGSTSDGVLDFWIDGVEIGPWDDLWLRTVPEVKVSLLTLGLFHHEEHSVEGMLLDHVVISESRIGCLE